MIARGGALHPNKNSSINTIFAVLRSLCLPTLLGPSKAKLNHEHWDRAASAEHVRAQPNRRAPCHGHLDLLVVESWLKS